MSVYFIHADVLNGGEVVPRSARQLRHQAPMKRLIGF